MNKKKLMILGIFLIVLLLGTLISLEKIDLSRLKGSVISATNTNTNQDRIHFLNVGTADCMIIESNGEFAIVDGSVESVGARLSDSDSYISKLLGDKKFKYVIATHNHVDHAAGLKYIVDKFSDSSTILYFGIYKYDNKAGAQSGNVIPVSSSDFANSHVGKVVSSNKGTSYQLIDKKKYLITKGGPSGSSITSTDQGSFNEVLKIGNFNINLLNTENDTKTDKIDGKSANDVGKVYIPELGWQTSYGDGNRDSIIELITHVPSGKKTLLAADMEHEDEFRYVCNTKYDAKSNPIPITSDLCRSASDINLIKDVSILKMGHHGGSTANTIPFLELVNPSAAVIVTRGQQTPQQSILSRANDAFAYLINNGKKVYMTAFDNKLYDNMDGYDENVKAANKEAIIATFFSSGEPIITSSGYDLSKALVNNYYKFVTEEKDEQKWKINDISYWLYTPESKNGLQSSGRAMTERNIYLTQGLYVMPDYGSGTDKKFRIYPIKEKGFYNFTDNSNYTLQYSARIITISPNSESIAKGSIKKINNSPSGWIKDHNGEWLYMDNGEAATGWKKVGNYWYYFSEANNFDNNRNYLRGEMYRDKLTSSENGLYYFNSDIKEKYWIYYFDKDGHMAANTTKTINGKTYSFNSSGRLYSSSSSTGVYASVDYYDYYCGSDGYCISATKVSYDCGEGSTGTAPATQSVANNSSFTIANNTNCKKTGSKFIGWNTEADGSGTSYTPGSSNRMSTNLAGYKYYKLKLYAQWNESVTKLKSGAEVNAIMKTLAGDTLNTGINQPETTRDINITSIVKSLVPPESLAATSSGPPYEIVSTSDSTFPVYMWYKNNTIYYYSEADTIYLNENSSSLFQCLEALTSIDFSGFDTSKVTNMQSMFTMDYALTSLDLRSFNTKNVTNMSYMFSQMRNITSINVSSFDTSKVTDMRGMFGDCERLTSLDITNFNTSNVTTMTSMFTRNYSLTSLDLSSFDTSKVTNMNQMFEECSSLVTIYASTNFKLDNVSVPLDMGVDISHIFRNCNKLVGGAGTVYSKNTAPANSTLGRVNTDYLVHDADTLILRVSPFGREYYKANDGDALVAYFFATAGYTHPILISTDPDAVAFRVGTRVFTYSSTYEYNNKTYYINSWEWGYEGNLANDGGVAKRLPGQHMSYDAAIEKLLELGYDVPTGGDGLAYAHIDVGSANPGYFTGKDDVTLYKINYSCGKGEGDAPETQFVRTGDDFTIEITPNTCSRPGYIFTGWNLNQDGTGYAGWTPGGHWTWRYTDGQYGIQNKELNLYAMWAPVSSDTYTITYNCGSGTGTPPSAQEVQRGANMVVSGNDDACTKEGYVFSGWNTKEDGSGNPTWYPRWEGVWRYINGQYGIENNELHLYAQYSPVGGDIYTINYTCGIDADGTPPITTKLKTGDQFIVSLTPKTCSKPGYVFAGWNTEADGSGDPTWKAGGKWTWSYVNGYFGIANNSVTLHAQWKIKEGSYLDSINKAVMSVGNNKIIALIEQNKKNITASYLNSNLDKSSGWSLYKKNGTLVNGSSSSLGANIYELLGEEDEEEDTIIATGDYLEHEDKGERYSIIISGDIYADGLIDVKDLYQSFLLFKGRNDDLSDDQYIAGDYDGSGKLDLVDLYKIYKKMKE